jgi:hypothetical protein
MVSFFFKKNTYCTYVHWFYISSDCTLMNLLYGSNKPYVCIGAHHNFLCMLFMLEFMWAWPNN